MRANHGPSIKTAMSALFGTFPFVGREAGLAVGTLRHSIQRASSSAVHKVNKSAELIMSRAGDRRSSSLASRRLRMLSL